MNETGRVVYWNGEFVAEIDARVSIYDSALMFGDMVFEMTRSFKGVQFRLRDHLERLFDGLRVLAIDVPMTIDEVETACHATVDANAPTMRPDDEHRLMIDVTRGLLGIVVRDDNGKREAIARFKSSEYAEQLPEHIGPFV